MTMTTEMTLSMMRLITTMTLMTTATRITMMTMTNTTVSRMGNNAIVFITFQ